MFKCLFCSILRNSQICGKPHKSVKLQRVPLIGTVHVIIYIIRLATYVCSILYIVAAAQIFNNV